MDNKFLIGLVLLLTIPIGVLEYNHQQLDVDKAQVAPVQPQMEQPQQPVPPKVEPAPEPPKPQPKPQPQRRPSCPPGGG